MTDLLLDTHLFVNLESFEFMPVTPSSFQIITMYLARSADTLTSLTLLDRYLTYEDIATLASELFHKNASFNLQTLVLNVQFFDPQLLTLLATSFLGLKRLELHAFSWGTENVALVHLPLLELLVRISHYRPFKTAHRERRFLGRTQSRFSQASRALLALERARRNHRHW
jgi:hypothetical protein